MNLAAAVILNAAVLVSLPAAAQQGAAAGAEEHHESATLPTTHVAQREQDASGTALQSLEFRSGDIRIRFGGFAKVDFIQDFDFVGNEDQFKVNSIPVDGDPDSLLGGGTNVSARQTRFTLDLNSGAGDDAVHAYVEGDFFGSGNSFRLRHGYGEWKGLLGGQTWTTFQDITARPFTLDYEGPDSEVFVRQAMIRYTSQTAGGNEWAVALEDPSVQVATAGGPSGTGRGELPDLVARYRFDRPWGHAQFAGIVRQLRFVSDDGALDETTGAYGVNLSGSYKIGGDVLMGHVAFGSGIGRYIESFGGTNSDAVVTSAGSLEALDAWAWTLGYTHHWTNTLSSTASIGAAEVDNEPGQSGDAIKSASSVHINLVHNAGKRVVIGGELMWGERENNDGASGDATRLQVSLQYKFR